MRGDFSVKYPVAREWRDRLTIESIELLLHCVGDRLSEVGSVDCDMVVRFFEREVDVKPPHLPNVILYQSPLLLRR